MSICLVRIGEILMRCLYQRFSHQANDSLVHSRARLTFHTIENLERFRRANECLFFGSVSKHLRNGEIQRRPGRILAFSNANFRWRILH